MGIKEQAKGQTTLLGQMSRERALRSADWVAEFLGVTKEWVTAATVAGTLPCIHVGDELRFDPDAIKAWGRTPQPAVARQVERPTSGSTSLKEIRSDLRRLQSATIQPGVTAITIEQAGARLGCSRSRIFELLKEGRLKRAPRVGRKVMISMVSVDALLKDPGGQKPARERRAPAPSSEAGAMKADVLALRDKYR